MDDQPYEITIFANKIVINEFDTDTLFMNIYNYWCFCHFLSPYYLQEGDATIKLKENIIKKWPTNDFCNVNLFLELISSGNKDVDPTVYFFKSEDYFEYLITSKLKFDQMVCDRHINKKKGNVLDSKMIFFNVRTNKHYLNNTLVLTT